MAQLLEQAVYATSNARFNVYMIDEVHMLTNHAFNAMLKTLEEPPEHVKFILATTDPQKIPVTVLSRCLQFNLKQMPPGHIISHLEDILGQEDVAFEVPALRLLAQGAHGSMRDALSLTDQAIAYAAGAVTLDAVQGMLGALDQTYLVRLLDALAKQDGADLLAVADEMASRSLSYNGALQDLGTLLHRIALAQTVPGAVPQDLPELADILRLAQAFDAQEVQLYYQIAVHGRNEIGLAPDEYAGFTMTLLRMLAFRPGQGGAEVTAPAVSAPTQSPARAAAAAASAASTTAPMRPPAGSSSAASSPAASPASAPPPARAAAATVASHAAAPVASPASPPPRVAPPPQPAPSAPAVSSARAAINAALEAARSASRGQQPQSKRPTAQSHQAAAAAAPIAIPSAPAAAAPSAPAPVSAPASPSGRATPAATNTPPPWQTSAAPIMPPAPPTPAAPSAAYDDNGSEPPSWVTEFSDDTAVAQDDAGVATAPAQAAAAAPVAVPAQVPARSAAAPKHAYVITPVEQLDWDGNWPALAADLPLRGVAQQLAFQTELIECVAQGNVATFRLRVPIDTLRASGNSEKLCAAVQERFPDMKIVLETEIGPVWYTASAEAQAYREACLRTAEETVAGDPFVQGMIRTFDAFVVPGSVKPAA